MFGNVRQIKIAIVKKKQILLGIWHAFLQILQICLVGNEFYIQSN